jgi:hypothetical protein
VSPGATKPAVAATTTGTGTAAGFAEARQNLIPVSVRGPGGALDLSLPASTAVQTLAERYAEQTSLSGAPSLYTTTGRPLAEESTLSDAGVKPGAVVIAAWPLPGVGHRNSGDPILPTGESEPGLLVVVGFALALAAGVCAAWFASGLADNQARAAVTIVLTISALLAILPIGRFVRARASIAPTFAAAATLAWLFESGQEQLPLLTGIAGLAAAVAAAMARITVIESDLAQRVWMVAGGGLFVLAALADILGLPAAATWSVALIAAMLAARWVPSLAINVPDQLLIDIDRLAVTAWSARERPANLQTNPAVSPEAVATLVARGTKLVTASCVAIAGVSVVSAVAMLHTATHEPDRIGAQILAFSAGGSLLLAARSYRQPMAQMSLHLAGMVCWLGLVWAVLPGAQPGQVAVLVTAVVALAAVLVVVGVAAGRGWRSAWWARRAEVGEVFSSSVALAMVIVASGSFRWLWEVGSALLN